MTIRPDGERSLSRRRPPARRRLRRCCRLAGWPCAGASPAWPFRFPIWPALTGDGAEAVRGIVHRGSLRAGSRRSAARRIAFCMASLTARQLASAVQIVANESAPQGLAQVIQGQVAGRAGGNRMPEHSGNISGKVDQGDSRDIAARAAGLGERSLSQHRPPAPARCWCAAVRHAVRRMYRQTLRRQACPVANRPSALNSGTTAGTTAELSTVHAL